MIRPFRIKRAARTLPSAPETPQSQPARALPRTADADDVEAVARLIAHGGPRSRLGFTGWAWLLASPISAIALLISLFNGDYSLSLILVFALMTSFTLERSHSDLERTRTALFLYDQLGKDRVSALAEALMWPNKRVRAIARICFARRLSILQPGDVDLLTPVQRRGLWRYLTPRMALTQPDFVVAIIEALEVIGDEQALPYLSRMTKLPPLLSSWRRVRKTAMERTAPVEQRIAVQCALLQSDAIGPTETVNAAGPDDHPLEPDHFTASVAVITPALQRLHAASEADTQFRAFEAEYGKMQQPGMRLAFLIASWLIITPYMVVLACVQMRDGNWPGSIAAIIVALLSTQLHRFTLTVRHRHLASLMEKMEEVHGTSRLIDALEWPDVEIQDIAASTLCRLLPRLRAADASLLSDRHRATLHRMLDPSRTAAYAGLQDAILQALQQVGDRAALPYVERLARSRPATARQQQVQDAALECLPFLQILAEQSRYSETLLRASAPGESSPDMLLRSASGGGATDQEQLLRAGAAGENAL